MAEVNIQDYAVDQNSLGEIYSKIAVYPFISGRYIAKNLFIALKTGDIQHDSVESIVGLLHFLVRTVL
jgi:hypothetical protein